MKYSIFILLGSFHLAFAMQTEIVTDILTNKDSRWRKLPLPIRRIIAQEILKKHHLKHRLLTRPSIELPKKQLKGDFFYPAGMLFNPQGTTLLIIPYYTKDECATLWNTSTGEKMYEVETDTTRMYVSCFDPSGETIAFSREESSVLTLWDCKAGQPILKKDLHPLLIDQVVYSPSGRKLAVLSEDYVISIWELPAMQKLATINAPKCTGTLTFDHTEEKIISSGKYFTTAPLAQVWNIATQVCIQSVESASGLSSPSRTFLVSHGSMLAGCQGRPSSDSTQLWSTETGKLIAEFSDTNDKTMAVPFLSSKDGIVITSSDRSVVKIRNITDGQPLIIIEANNNTYEELLSSPHFYYSEEDVKSGVAGVTYFARGNKVLTASWGLANFYFWDCSTGKPIAHLPYNCYNLDKLEKNYAVSEQGDKVAVHEKQTVTIWDSEPLSQLPEFLDNTCTLELACLLVALDEIKLTRGLLRTFGQRALEKPSLLRLIGAYFLITPTLTEEEILLDSRRYKAAADLYEQLPSQLKQHYADYINNKL